MRAPDAPEYRSRGGACQTGVLSNGAIAERLVISERTVKSHVTTILGKLHLADRTQAAIFAWREASPGRNAPRVRLRASGSSAAT